jgi:hypothetical protein
MMAFLVVMAFGGQHSRAFRILVVIDAADLAALGLAAGERLGFRVRGP